VFLSELNIFGELRGNKEESLIRKAWGQNLDEHTYNEIPCGMVKSIFDLFEIIVVMCISRFQKDNDTDDLDDDLANLGPLNMD
jgi:hypothetical protein